MTRRRLLALVCFSAPIVGVAVACGFPDVEYKPVSTTVPDTGAEASIVDDAGDASDDGAVVTAQRDGAMGIDAAVCGTGGRKKCDCDGDGYYATNCDGGAPDGAVLNDCDDLDSFRHPGQSLTDAGPTSDGTWDWNCSKAEEKAYNSGTCTGGSVLGSSCGLNGTKMPVPCGGSADVYQCAVTNPVLGSCGLTNLLFTAPQVCQ